MKCPKCHAHIKNYYEQMHTFCCETGKGLYYLEQAVTLHNKYYDRLTSTQLKILEMR